MAAAELGDEALVNVTNIDVGNLRNGVVGYIAKCQREASIPRCFFWGSPRHHDQWAGDAAGFHASLPGGFLIDVCVRSVFGQIVGDAVAVAQAANAAAAAPAFNADAARDAAAGLAANRSTAIVLGAARAAVTKSYGIREDDLIPTERAGAIFEFVRPAAAADEAAYRARMETARHGWRARISSGRPLAAANPAEHAAMTMAPMTAPENEYAHMVYMIAIGSVTRAGSMLLTEDHHYSSATDKRRRHAAIESEVIGKFPATPVATFRAAGMDAKDLIWHKSVHPIATSLLTALAQAGDSAAKLGEEGAGFGSMTVGLPAEEDTINRAGSYLALLDTVGPMLANAGHTVALPGVVAALAFTRNAPRVALPANIPLSAILAPHVTDINIRSRRDAAKKVLLPMLDKAAPVAAWMFGYYRAIAEDMGIRANTPEGSLLRSYSLRKAMESNLPMASDAQEKHRLRKRAMRQAAEEGNLETINYSDI